ncbi:MAG TPA: ABC transporter substrate-binding protein [Ktedonobacteraceae bacterium]|nr:ABC transporter substrate-binding protein [Ktedonobacteraceae bacterium]
MRYLKQCLLGMLIVIVLAACGGATPSGSGQSGPIKITFWYGLSGANGNVVQSVINKYNQSQNKYHVTGVFQSSYDDTLSKFNASIVGNNLPNVVQIYDIGTQRMIDTKKIVPVQNLINRDHLQSIVDDLEPAIRSYYTIGGTLYSMPFNSSTAVMYFDKNAFRQAGLNPDQKAWTYDELLAAAKKLTTRDASGKVARTGVALFDYAWLFEQEEAIQNALQATPDNGRTQRATKFVFNNQAGVNWLNFQKQLLDEGAATYSSSSASTDAATAFLSGKAAIMFDSIASLRGYIATAQKNGGKVDVGTAYMPRETNAQGRNIIGGASLWITNQGTSEQQEGAWDFIKFAVQPELQAYWSSNTGYIPIRLSTYQLADMKATLTKYPQFQSAIDQIRAAPTNYSNAGCIAGNLLTERNNVQQAMDGYLTGKISSAQTALDQAAQKSNSSLDEYNSALS